MTELAVALLGPFSLEWIARASAPGQAPRLACVEADGRLDVTADVFVLQAAGLDVDATLEAIMRRAQGPRPTVILTDDDDDPRAAGWLSQGAVGVLGGARDAARAPEHAAAIRDSAGVTVVYRPRRRTPAFTPRGTRRPGARPVIPAVGIASSTGGPRALEPLLAELPIDLPAAILIAQHMGDPFVPLLVDTLQRHSKLPLAIATEGARLEAGRVFLAPGDGHLEVARPGVLRIVPPTDDTHHVPSGDYLLGSLADAYGERALGVVLSGIGSDGRAGAAAIREAGGQVYVQAEPTCAVWGMPKAVWEAGLARDQLPPAELGRLIARRYSRQGAT